jgi:hypothetical protein
LFLFDLLLAFIVALLLSLVFIPIVSSRRGGRQGSLITVVLFFFLILFFATWAGGVWVTPFGPAIWGVNWMPFVAVGLLVALLLAAATEPSRRSSLHSPAEPATAEAEAVGATFGLMFWILMIGLLAILLSAYFVD